MIRTIFFDLDDTLLDFQKAEALALRKALQQLGLEPTEAVITRYSAINQELWRMLEDKLLTRAQVLVRRFELLFQEFNLAIDAQQAQDLYHHLLSIGHYFMPGAVKLLQTLQHQYDLYIVSNGSSTVQDGRIKSADIAPYFKQIFISERVGVNKPDIRFFERCFAEIPHFAPETAIIIGDSLTSDIRGGKNAGILTCWYNPRGEEGRADITPDFEIRSLCEIPALLQTL